MKQTKHGAAKNGKVVSGGETEKGVAMTQTPEHQPEDGRAYVEKLTGQGDKQNALGEPTSGFSDQFENFLHEKGKGCEGVEKKLEKIAQLRGSVSDSSTNHGDQSVDMHWESALIPTKEPTFKFSMVPNKEQNKNGEGPLNKEIESGMMALNYDLKEGWVASKLGLRNGHWKQLVREVKQNKPKPKGKQKEGAKP